MDQCAGMEELKGCDRFDCGAIWFEPGDRHRTDGTKEWAKTLSAIDKEALHGARDRKEFGAYRIDV